MGRKSKSIKRVRFVGGTEQTTEADLKKLLIEQKIKSADKNDFIAEEALGVSKSNASFEKTKFWVRIWGKIVSAITGFFGKILKPVFNSLAPYIALAIVILFIIFGIMLFVAPSPKPVSLTQVNPPQLKWYERALPWYQLRFFSTPPSINRPKEENGRCDNVEWQHTGGNDAGFCVRTYKPENIAWTFDMDKMPEVRQIPKQLSEEMNTTSKMQVYIPWEAQGTFFLPQCSKAFFREVDENGNEVRTPAGHLFVDNGLVCKKVEKPSTSYGTAYRRRETTNLYDFASEEDPKCNA